MAGNKAEREKGFQTSEKAFRRLHQREIILEGLGEDQRNLIKKLFPIDHPVEDDYVSKPDEPETYIDDALLLFNPFEFDEREGGHNLLFNLACTAQTPHELYNIFQGIKTAECMFEKHYHDEQIYPFRKAFLNKIRNTNNHIKLDSKGTWVISEIGRVLMQLKDKRQTSQMTAVGKEIFNPENKFYEKHKNSLAEVYLYLILTRDHEKYWNDAFLFGTQFFNFGEDKDGNDKLAIFSENASFWQNVDGSWIGLETPPDQERVFTEPEKELERLRKRFQLESEGWFYQREKLERQNYDLQNKLRNANSYVIYLTAERDKYKAQAGAKGPSYQIKEDDPSSNSDPIDNFLKTFNLTKSIILKMSEKEKEEIASKLRRVAAMSFHPESRLCPNEDLLKKINAYLDTVYKPRRS